MRRLYTLTALLLLTPMFGPSVTAQEASPGASPMASEAPVELLWESTGGPDPLVYPADIALDSEGNLWIIDAANNRLQIISADGAFIETWGSEGAGEGEFNFIRDPNDPHSAIGGIGFAPDGSFYVADAANWRVQKFDSDRNFVSYLGEYGTGDGQFVDPIGVAVDADGNVYVIDDARNIVQKFNADGQFLLKFGGLGFGSEQLWNTGMVTVDAGGNVWVADFGNDRVKKFSAEGELLLEFGGFGEGEGEFRSPLDVAVDASGNVYVSDGENARIQVFDGNGQFLAAWGGDLAFAGPLELDGDGNIYVTDVDNHRVLKFGLLPPLAQD